MISLLRNDDTRLWRIVGNNNNILAKTMDYEKARLTPINETNEEPKSEAEKRAREELKRHRQETQRFKQKYFEYYDDVKINHREDW